MVMIIERYENVLNFLKSVQMEKGADLSLIRSPLDQLESNLKCIPNGPLFNDIFPTEIKNYILKLSHPCDNGAYTVASVCQDWKRVLKSRFKEKKVILDKCKCKGKDCVKTEEMLKAALVHKIDSHLVIQKPVTGVDSKLLADALTSVSKFTITKTWHGHFEIISDDQADYLIESISTGDKIMEEVNLVKLDLRNFNQETLANCLVSKIKKLALTDVDFNNQLFMAKLQASKNLNLTHLILSLRINVPTSDITADALCNVENVELRGSISNVIMQRLVENMLRTPIKMKALVTEDQPYHVPDFRYLNPEDLKTVFNQMETIKLKGMFTAEQLETIRSAPGVEVPLIQNGFGRHFYFL